MAGSDAGPRRRRQLHPVAERLLSRLPRRLIRPVELLVRTTVDARDDRIVGLAAEVAFFSILSLPPLLLTVVAALGFLPGDQADEFVTALIRVSNRVFTVSTVEDVIDPTIRAVVESPRTDVVSFGFVLSLLSASRAVRVVLIAVTIAYDLDGFRPNWRQRMWSLVLTLALFVIVPVLVPLLLAGPDFGRALARSEWVPPMIADLWPVLYWGGVGLLAVTMIAALYHLAAPWWTPFRRDLPGAFLAVGIWIASSEGLGIYTRNAITGEDSIYGLLGGPLALLVWLYLVAFGVLLGGEFNAELERLWPSPEHRRVPPGERLRRLWSTTPIAERGEALRDRVVSATLRTGLDDEGRRGAEEEHPAG